MRTVKKIWNTVTTVLVVLVLLLVLLLVGGRLFGLKTYAVLSGSMEPAYPTGSLLYVRKTEQPLQVGDTITFRLTDDTPATHRIVEVVPDEHDPNIVRYRTKGDANETADGALVEKSDILGVPVLMIPWLGFFAKYIQSPPGSYVAIACGAILVLLVLLPEFMNPDKSEKQ